MKLTSAVRALSASVVVAAATVAVPMATNSLSSALGGSSLAIGTAQAQQQQKEQEKTRVTPAMSEQMYKEFGKVQELVSPEEEGKEPNYRGALEALRDLEKDCREDCNKYELATMYQYYGFVYYYMDQLDNAIEANKKVLAQSPEIPLGMESSILYTLAQLYFQKERYDEAIESLNKWMDITAIIGADAYAFRAQIHYVREDFSAALRDVNTAIDMVEKKGEIGKENWYAIKSSVLTRQERYNEVIPVTQLLIRHYPKVSYWRQLASMYGVTGQEDKQLYALDAMFVAGYMTNGAEYRNLASLLMSKEVPYQAAQVLQKGLDEDVVEPDAKNLEILAMALRYAQEIDDSIPVMERAAEKAETGDLYARLAGIYLAAEEYKKVENAADKAIDRGDIKRPGELYLTLGMARFNLEEYDAAIKALQESVKVNEKGTKQFAEQWLQHVRQQKKRAEELARSQGDAAPPPSSSEG